jgi:ribosomal protein S18 acetylase RimI-like enzyme
VTATIGSPESPEAAAIAQVGRATFAASFAHLFPPAALDRYLARTWSEAKIAASLEKPSNRYMVARCAGQVVGFVKAKLDYPAPHRPPGVWHQLQKMYVLPTHQGQGLGSRLLRALLGESVAAGDAWWLQVHLGNHGAHRLYLRHGFTEHHRGIVEIEGVPIDFRVLVRMAGPAPASATPPVVHGNGMLPP